MLFNSLNFAIFLPVVFIAYWFFSKGSLKVQNIILLIASYFFYGCWDYRFLFLLIFSTLLDYYTGLKMYGSKTAAMKRFWFYLSVCINLGFLGLFKYYNFFVDSFSAAISYSGYKADLWTLKVILPVGISFYTFHGLSYVIDIYKNRIKPERNFIDYTLFVSFFPLLVAGPIERATHLLPQIKVKREFDYSKAIDGLKQILWGLFKKVVIADNCAVFANMIFGKSADYSGSTHLLGAIFFTFQIYCDFSGYSDIAIGTAKLFGIDLLRNFAYPYFSRDIAEFWRRWHISLSSWFRDYLYIPLGGSKVSMWKKVRNTFIIFIVSGFWHGANWTFLFWGFLNALYIIPSIIFNTNRNHIGIVGSENKVKLKDVFNILITFCLTVFAWIFFRADSLKDAFKYIAKMFSRSIISVPKFERMQTAVITLIFIVLFLIIEWCGKEGQYAIANLGKQWPRPLRWSFYYVIIVIIFLFAGSSQQFIYFQF